MSHNRRCRFFLVLISFILLFNLLPLSAYADIGPKPSIHISFVGMENIRCCGTLLSKSPSTGPFYEWDGVSERLPSVFDDDTFHAFCEYKDTDGFHFLQYGFMVSQEQGIDWTYFPPSVFKVLLYFPDYHIFAESDILERYAFDSYFDVDMNGFRIESITYDESKSGNQRLEDWNVGITRSYHYKGEIASLILRIILNLLIEIGIAFLFGYHKKKQILLLIAANAATQILLNVMLAVTCYRAGSTEAILQYFFLESLVFLAEAILYLLFLPSLGQKKESPLRIIAYTATANLVSFCLGLLLFKLIPSIF